MEFSSRSTMLLPRETPNDTLDTSWTVVIVLGVIIVVSALAAFAYFHFRKRRADQLEDVRNRHLDDDGVDPLELGNGGFPQQGNVPDGHPSARYSPPSPVPPAAGLYGYRTQERDDFKGDDKV